MQEKWSFLKGWHIVKNDFDDISKPDEYPIEDILLIQKDDLNLDVGWYGGFEGKYCLLFFKGSWLKGELLEKLSSRDKDLIFQRIEEITFQYEKGAYDKLNGYLVDEDDSSNQNIFTEFPDFMLRQIGGVFNSIVISRVTNSEDFLLTQTMAHQIWTQHYTPIIGAEQVSYMLEKFQSVAAMQKQVAEGYEYYLIYDGEKAVGYFSFLPEKEGLFLSKIYVLAEMRGKGFGRKAMEYLEQQAIQRGLRSIRLTVNKYNTKSIEAYLKMDFEKIRPVVFDIGQGFIMDDFEMKKNLNEK